MFNTAELGQKVSKTEFKEREDALREQLLTLQYRTLELGAFPVIIDFAGVDGAGKGSTVNILNKWMDPRWIRTIGYQTPTQAEQAQIATSKSLWHIRLVFISNFRPTTWERSLYRLMHRSARANSE